MAEMTYASKGVAGTGLGLGIAGTALGVLAGGLGNIGLANARNVGGCSEDHFVNRYEAAQSARIAELETEVKLRDSNIYTDSKILELYKYVDGKFTGVEKELCDQKVFNATCIANTSCIANQVNQLFALTKLVIPNGSVCPGWGTATVTVTPATTTAG
jgi:hypothetical protein